MRSHPEIGPQLPVAVSAIFFVITTRYVRSSGGIVWVSLFAVMSVLFFHGMWRWWRSIR